MTTPRGSRRAFSFSPATPSFLRMSPISWEGMSGWLALSSANASLHGVEWRRGATGVVAGAARSCAVCNGTCAFEQAPHRRGGCEAQASGGSDAAAAAARQRCCYILLLPHRIAVCAASPLHPLLPYSPPRACSCPWASPAWAHPFSSTWVPGRRRRGPRPGCL